MNVLLIGGGGREDALAWAISKSPRLGRLACLPGNPGTARRARPIALDPSDLDGVVRHALSERYDLVVIGPEGPLVAGLADRLEQAAIPTFGPRSGAANIEGSKVFAKQFMERHGIPTARFRIFEDADAARAHLESSATDYPLVLKADGLAAGKGVLLVDDPASAVAGAMQMLRGESFGAAGRRIVVEEHLSGHEASFFVLADGRSFVPLETCQDYKRSEDGDLGPNTGGMGAYSPSAYLTGSEQRAILDRIVAPTIRGLEEEGQPYRGVLYVGVMLTAEGPKTLEFNARFGDPEAQALLPRLDGDWLALFDACARGALGSARPRWKEGASVCVVMASAGYPGGSEAGHAISGIPDAEREGALVFHAGTVQGEDGILRTAGGRVLGVTALGSSLRDARERAYRAVARITWRGERHRGDVARDALSQLEGGLGS